MKRVLFREGGSVCKLVYCNCLFLSFLDKFKESFIRKGPTGLLTMVSRNRSGNGRTKALRFMIFCSIEGAVIN